MGDCYLWTATQAYVSKEAVGKMNFEKCLFKENIRGELKTFRQENIFSYAEKHWHKKERNEIPQCPF